ncbi:TetR family transcriptional regulator [Gordonibacter sp. An232A]|nr:TetR family transcriptional regulator [Gordonibacter sp. An232A]
MAEGFRKGESRRDDIVEAARQLYEERGLSRTTVRAIAERVGVTRTLFYHYFADKDAVTSAVLDDYVADYLEALRLWNESRRPGDIERALESVVKLLRLGVFEHDAFRLSLASKENAELYLEFLDRVADRTASYIVSTTVRDYDAAHGVRIDHVHETFYILIVGMVSFVRRHPEAGDEVLKDLIAQTLHMERGDARPSGGG